MSLVEKIQAKVWELFSSYDKVKYYMDKWYSGDLDNFGNGWENFTFCYNDKGKIDLNRTLHTSDGETLLKIAIDLGIDTPDFIPCIPTFKNELKSRYTSALESFNSAISNIEEKPDIAISLANSTLESIIKEILKDERILVNYKESHTLYELTGAVFKAFEIFPDNEMPKDLRDIGSALLKASQKIEDLRSQKTQAHGKTSSDIIVDEPLSAYFIVNSVTTIGLFLNSFYKKKFPPIEIIATTLPESIDPDDLPF